MQNLKTLFIIVIISFSGKAQVENLYNFEISKILSEPYFFNFQIKENNLYLGTNKGIYEFNLKEGLNLIDEDLKGYINSNLKLEKLSNIKFSSKYNNILPIDYRINKKTIISFEQLLMIISRGKLFIFKPKEYNYNHYPSTRAISENYIGTYEGIFKNKKRAGKHKYTNGFIREFRNKTFICFDGLIEIKEDTILVQRDFLMSLNKPKPSYVWDIAEYNDNEYLLFTENGLYIYNELNSKTTQFLKAEKGRYNYLGTDFNFNKPNYIYFYDKFTYYRLDTIENKITIIKSFKHEIIYLSKDRNGGMFSSFYVLFKNRNLKHLFESKPNQYEEVLLLKTNNGAHTIFSNKNYLFVMGNKGLDIYDFPNKKIRKGFIKDELNKNAFFLKNDTLRVGGIFGTYKFPSNEININSIVSESKLTSNKNYIYFIIILMLAMIILLFLIFLKFRVKKNDNRLLIQKIDTYIEENLKEVSIEKLKTKFNLTNHNLYKLMGDQKPGSYIRKKRFKLVKLLAKNNYSLDEISDKTGFSISYLKKIV